MGLFGKKKSSDPREQVKEWNRKLRRERNSLERQINQIKREEQKAMSAIKEATKRNDSASMRLLAKEVMGARRAVTRITTAKANISSVESQLTHQASQLRIAGCLQQSSDVMISMNNLIRVPEINVTMRELSREMMKAGILEEMIEDALDPALDPLIDEDQEIDKIIEEVGGHGDKKEKLEDHGKSIALPELPQNTTTDKSEDVGEVDKVAEEVQKRLVELRSS